MENITKIYYKSWINCLQMLKDRKYSANYNKYSINYDEFKLLYDKDIMFFEAMNNHEQVYIKFSQSSKSFSSAHQKIEILNSILKQSSKSKLGDLIKFMNGEKLRIIIIYNSYNVKNDKFDNKFEKFSVDLEYLEVFQVHKMSINIINYIYQPKYILLNNEQIKLLYKTYDTSYILIGSICINDPINRYYNGRKGNVYKIIRPEGNIYFRKVILKKMNMKK